MLRLKETTVGYVNHDLSQNVSLSPLWQKFHTARGGRVIELRSPRSWNKRLSAAIESELFSRELGILASNLGSQHWGLGRSHYWERLF